MRILSTSPINQKKNNQIAYRGATELSWLTNRISIAELNNAMKEAKAGAPETFQNLFTQKHGKLRLQALNHGHVVHDNNSKSVLSFNFINRKDNETVFFESTPFSITYRHEKPLGAFKNLTYSYENGQMIKTLTTGFNGIKSQPKIEILPEGASRFEKMA